MFYVYSRHIGTGREDYFGMYDTQKEAVKRIAFLYSMDSQLHQSNEYYYFMKQH